MNKLRNYRKIRSCLLVLFFLITLIINSNMSFSDLNDSLILNFIEPTAKNNATTANTSTIININANKNVDSCILVWNGSRKLFDEVSVEPQEKYVKNPILTRSSSGWDEWGIRDQTFLVYPNGSLVYDADGNLSLYYRGENNNRASSIGIAICSRSNDKKTMACSKYMGNPVFTPEEMGWNSISRVGTGSVIKNGSTYWLYFWGWNGTGNYELYLANSSDGINWRAYSLSPILSSSQFYPERGISLQNVRYVKKGFWVMYIEHSAYDIVYATSTDGISWTVQNNGKPIIVTTDWGYKTCNPKFIELEDNKYIMGINSYPGNGVYWRGGFLISTNLIDWVDYGKIVLDAGADSYWDDDRIEHLEIIKDDINGEIIGMTYFGCPSGHATWHCAIGYTTINQSKTSSGNYTMKIHNAGGSTTALHNITHLKDGEQIYYVWCNDSAGNSNITETRILNVDAKQKIGNDSLILKMHFDNNLKYGENNSFVYDFSGNGNNGIVMGAFWTPSGKFNGSFNFDGNEDYIALGNSNILNLTYFTISFWAKPNQISDLRFILSKRYGSDYTVPYQLYFKYGRLRLVMGNKTTSMCAYSPISTANEWQYFTAVVNGTSMKVYRNAVEGISTEFIGQRQYNNKNLYIGKYGSSNKLWYNGLIDELKIWNKALTEEEIKEEYEKADEPENIGMVLYFSFNETNSNTAHDSIGKNHGTIHGAEWTQGKMGNALNFDGNEDYIALGNSNILNLTYFTISFWAKPNQISDLRFILSKRYGSDYTVPYQLYFKYGRLRLVMGNKTTSMCAYSPISTANEWQYFTAVVNGTSMKVYRNAVEGISTEFIGQRQYNNKNLYIGKYGSSNKLWYNGLIDELKIWNKALTEEEIKEEYEKADEPESL